eukprot:CAMPEP_0194045966 /NCGR_PEP_ID=MMETSP0009_2-20130614/19081_1 /TAXON_ID=210454 /ORGANISM="Grammatophora oceanica, Strain CCMP 410" /LENGTH=172 /DNA_ID=CAMNT_0038691037 /DNA_START=78 /DNA_END=596 /DNA_ORIENTATION=+
MRFTTAAISLFGVVAALATPLAQGDCDCSSAVQQAVGPLEKELSALSASKGELASSLEGMNGQVSTCQSTLAKESKVNDSLIAQLKALEKEVQPLEKMANSIGSLESSLADINKEIENAPDVLAATKDAMKKSMSEVEGLVSKAQKEAEKAGKNVNKLQNKIAKKATSWFHF